MDLKKELILNTSRFNVEINHLDMIFFNISYCYIDFFLLLIGPGITNQLTFLVKVGGQVKFEEKSSKPFNQTFLITAVGDKWKIVSDCFRALET